MQSLISFKTFVFTSLNKRQIVIMALDSRFKFEISLLAHSKIKTRKS